MRLTNRFRLFGLLALLILVPFSALADLKVTFLSTQGAVLVQADGQTMLVGSEDVDTNELLNELSSLEIENIDLLAYPAPDGGSSAGINAVLGKYGTASLLVPGGQASSTPLLQGISTATPPAQDISYVTLPPEGISSSTPPPQVISSVTPAPGAPYDLGSAKVTVLDASTLALRITYGERSFLFVQDAESFAQALLQGNDLKADVLAVDGPLPQALLEEASPLLVIDGSADTEAVEPAMEGASPTQEEAASPALEEDTTTTPKEDVAPVQEDTSVPHVLRAGEGVITFTTDGTAIRAEFAASGVTIQPSVNMRKEASQKAGKAATLTKGTVLNLLGADISKEDLWYKAEAGGKTGYIRGDLVAFVSKEEAETLAQATPTPKKSTSGSKPKPPSDDGSNPFPNVGSDGEDPAPCH